jgi:hypothetical protein
MKLGFENKYAYNLNNHLNYINIVFNNIKDNIN